MRDEVMMTRDDDLLEFAIRSRMRWQRDGTDWVLFYNRRRMGRVVPDSKWPGMFRSLKSAGRLSDMANLSWAKDAVLGDAIREIEWSVRHDGARDPPKSPAKRGQKPAQPVRHSFADPARYHTSGPQPGRTSGLLK
jgi:hypothetical protein